MRASPHRNGWEESNGCVQVSVGVLNTRVRDGYVQLSNGGDRARERWIRAVEQRGFFERLRRTRLWTHPSRVMRAAFLVWSEPATAAPTNQSSLAAASASGSRANGELRSSGAASTLEGVQPIFSCWLTSR